jgi:glycosyltransferase involved in cell wall biosynthesis
LDGGWIQEDFIKVFAQVGKLGLIHFNADTPEDWYNSLDRLLSEADLRAKMAAAGRKYAIENYDLESQADRLAAVFRKVTVK